jgi:hypothetical protein
LCKVISKRFDKRKHVAVFISDAAKQLELGLALCRTCLRLASSTSAPP